MTLEDEPAENLYRLWGLLSDALLELPEDYIEPMVELVKAIEELPEPDFSALKESKRPYRKLWKGLYGFGHLWYDCFWGGRLEHEVKKAEGAKRDALRHEYTRGAEVEARLIAAGSDCLTISAGYEMIADALESNNWMPEFTVPAAAKWLLVFLAERFWRGANDGEKSWGLEKHDTSDSKARSRCLWKGPLDGKMSLDRWHFWEGRLRELQGEEGHAGDAAKVALAAINKIHASS